MADESDDIAHLERLAEILRRRLGVLEAQRGRFVDRDVPPHVVLEVEDIKQQLARVDADLRRLRDS
jgi:hypothetical protein